MSLPIISTTNIYPIPLLQIDISNEYTREGKIAKKILSQSTPQKIAKINHLPSKKDILKKTISTKICELQCFTSNIKHKIYLRVQKSLSALFAIKKLDSRISLDEVEREIIKNAEFPDETALIRLNYGIKFLRHQRKKWVNRLLEFRKAPPGFFGVISTCLSAIYTLGTFTKSMSDKLLVGLRATTSWIGGISGGISILFGGVEIFLGITKLRNAAKQFDTITLSIDKFEEECKKIVPADIASLWSECYKLQHKKLLVEELKAHKNRTRALYQVLAGTFAIVGGALGIASICTGGWAAVGLSIAAGVAGSVGIGISITSFLHTRPLKKKIEAIRTFTQADLEKLSVQIQGCSNVHKKQLAALLGITIEELNTPLEKIFFEVMDKKHQS